MNIKKLILGEFLTNCYIIDNIVVIDPAAQAEKILPFCSDLKYIILTHGHADHIGAVDELRRQTGAKVLIHSRDFELAQNVEENVSWLMKKPCITEADIKIDTEPYYLEAEHLKFEIINTPGHTMGSICIKIDDILFSGDTLFKGTVGKTEYGEASHEMLVESIKTKLYKLGDDVKVYPGHGFLTTIGDEKKNNIFVRTDGNNIYDF